MSEKRTGWVRFVASEALAYARNAAMVPLKAREVSAGSEPVVLLIHGHGGGPRPWSLLERALGRAGFHRTAAWEFRSTGSVPALADRLAVYVDEKLGDAPVHVVGHSLGGVIARWWLQELGGLARARTLTTLSTPHRGISGIPGAGILPVVRDLVAGSAVMRRLEETATTLEALRCLSIVSTRDHFVRTVDHARFAAAEVHTVGHAGHVGVLFAEDVHARITAHLKEEP